MLLELPHSATLLPGRLIRREKRFIAHVRLDSGQSVVAHCINPGKMEGLVRPGAPVWLTEAPNKARRKLAYTWELIRVGRRMIGANTTMSNRLVAELLTRRRLRGLASYSRLAQERPYGDGSRVDFWLLARGRQHFVEVKSCHLVYPDRCGYFPDAKSERAARHLHELVRQVRAGHRATVLFTVQHGGARSIRPSDVHDPEFAAAARGAAAAGVRFRAVRVRPSLRGYCVEQEIPVDLRGYDPRPVERWRRANLPWSGSGW
jgi:sugar fermentation stimulation protein A